MDDLPAVKDDHRNIRQTVQLLGVPDTKENIFELVDGSWQQMEDLDKLINGKIKCRTKELKNPMGICGLDYENGLPWDRSKVIAMQNEHDDDCVVVSLFRLV